MQQEKTVKGQQKLETESVSKVKTAESGRCVGGAC